MRMPKSCRGFQVALIETFKNVDLNELLYLLSDRVAILRVGSLLFLFVYLFNVDQELLTQMYFNFKNNFMQFNKLAYK